MRLENTYDVIIGDAKETSYTGKDGKTGKQYSVGISYLGECGTVNCSEDVYKVASGLKFKPCRLIGVVDSDPRYNFMAFRFARVAPAEK